MWNWSCSKRLKASLIRVLLLGGISVVWILSSLFQYDVHDTRDASHRKPPLPHRTTNNSQNTSDIWIYGGRKLLVVTTQQPTTTVKSNDYPPDAFSDEQLRQGAIVLHVIGIIYTFVALAIICDEFFVPSLNVITEKLDISEDVAGATFMAAGGSAPELFTSLIGVFTNNTDVGIGTIVGSAVFNILFVIGMCALVSEHVLDLTWWPLFRDVTFYSIDLLVLMGVFYDGKIQWYEAVILLTLYFLYVTFMVFNLKIETFVKGRLKKNQVQSQTVHASDILISDKLNRSCSLPVIHNGSGRFRHGVLQLMIHTIDPLSESRVHEKANHLQAVTGSRVALGTPPYSIGSSSVSQDISSNKTPQIAVINGTGGISHQALGSQHTVSSELEDSAPNSPPSGYTYGAKFSDQDGHPRDGNHRNGHQSDGHPCDGNPRDSIHRDGRPCDDNHRDGHHRDSIPNNNSNSNNNHTANRTAVIVTNGDTILTNNTASGGHYMGEKSHSHPHVHTQRRMSLGATLQSRNSESLNMDNEEPLDISWPKTHLSRLTYILLIPITIPLWLTCPDVRRPKLKKLFPLTFIISICWIAAYSYVMVWLANTVGNIIGIPSSVMGLTFLAAGTSIPDLITSIIVAKKGFGDMAVSSSVGSNIFDVTVGLPFPWILFVMIYQKEVTVDTAGMFCLVALLFLMLIFVIAIIAKSGWKMTKILGCCMFLMYITFVVVAVLMTLNVFSCPV